MGAPCDGASARSDAIGATIAPPASAKRGSRRWRRRLGACSCASWPEMSLQVLLIVVLGLLVGTHGRAGAPDGPERLRRAAEMGELENVKKLILKDKIDPNSTPMFGETPLHWSSQSGKLEVVEELIGLGADVNKIANDGSTPLSKAAMNGNSEVVRALCEAGADPNIQAGKKNWGAMHYAARRSQQEAIEIMVEFGADPLLKGSNGETPYALVKGRWNEVNAELTRLTPVMSLLEEFEVLEDNDGDDKSASKEDL